MDLQKLPLTMPLVRIQYSNCLGFLLPFLHLTCYIHLVITITSSQMVYEEFQLLIYGQTLGPQAGLNLAALTHVAIRGKPSFGRCYWKEWKDASYPLDINLGRSLQDLKTAHIAAQWASLSDNEPAPQRETWEVEQNKLCLPTGYSCACNPHRCSST